MRLFQYYYHQPPCQYTLVERLKSYHNVATFNLYGGCNCKQSSYSYMYDIDICMLNFTDITHGYDWLFILLLWTWKNFRQGCCCIDYNFSDCNNDFIYAGSKYVHLINLNVLPNVTIDANYRICQKPLTIN